VFTDWKQPSLRSVYEVNPKLSCGRILKKSFGF